MISRRNMLLGAAACAVVPGRAGAAHLASGHISVDPAVLMWEESATLLLAVFDGYTMGSPEYPHYVAAAGMDTGKRYHWWRREPANIGQMMYFGAGHPSTEVVRVYATGGW